MRGDGKIAESIKQLFTITRNKHMGNRDRHEFNLSAFERPAKGQLHLF
jgi:hypothetical protein